MNRRGCQWLVFRLGGVGFLLAIESVVEIVDEIEDGLDPEGSDLRRGIVAALFFRRTWIPAVDPALKLGLACASKIKNRVAIVLRGEEGNWAILADQVRDLPVDAVLDWCEVPFLLKVSSCDYYSELVLLNHEPLVVFPPDRYYGPGIVD